MRFSPSIFLLVLAFAGMAKSDDAAGKTIFGNLCFSCHGVTGEGNALLKAPSIAGLPAWYVMAQFDNFQRDRRGFDPKDTEGQIMRAAAKTLNENTSRAVAGYVEKLKRIAPKQTIMASTTAGELLYSERCMECHRYNMEGELAFGSAPLVGLPDWYLKAQLIKFKTKQRGVLKEDANGQKMAFAVGYIEDDDALDSVVAYLVSLQNEAARAQKKISDPFEEAAAAPKP